MKPGYSKQIQWRGKASETVEGRRLYEDALHVKYWKKWGPYLSERQWGTVREDYSEEGNAWTYLPHNQARSRAYRWGEDGLLGITDNKCRLCFALALWNGKDPILKERMFGLTGPEGNHGEDVKEYYYYLDSTPTHSYMKALYKYPQAAFPYETLLRENRRRGKDMREFELSDTGVFGDSRYFDVQAEYAKESPDDIRIRVTITNRGPEQVILHLLPTIWFRNTWTWGCRHEGCETRSRIWLSKPGRILTQHPSLGRNIFLFDEKDTTEVLFTHNETNAELLFGTGSILSWNKDGFHEYIVQGNKAAVCPEPSGSKAAPHIVLQMGPGEQRTTHFRLTGDDEDSPVQSDSDDVFTRRIKEANDFYNAVIPEGLSEDARSMTRQAYAGLLWSKQFYHYIVRDWLEGDRLTPSPPAARKSGRNADWKHLYNYDVISVPDKWEYPWYALWDLAFHMVPLADIDPYFAKEQLELFLREWYMHPNGQMPAYEYSLSDANPPVHAWACWRVYKICDLPDSRDRMFLERVFQKLLLNFTWWVNRKDHEGNHLFSGGFLGLDNIGIFDRSRKLPTGGYLDQADGTAWMAFYCTTLLSIALELSKHNPAYQDIAFKFFRHFVDIADAMNSLNGDGLWNEEDGFYYDKLHTEILSIPFRVRSLVGLVPLIAVEVLEEETIQALPEFRKRIQWFLENRKDLSRYISYMELGSNDESSHTHRLLAIPSRHRLERILKYMLDEEEFLSPYGIRSLSRFHKNNPYEFKINNQVHRVTYTPGESDNYMFGGNSNWRGPIWFPINYLLIEALERYDHFYGETLKVECPTGSGNRMTLGEVARELSRRHVRLFLRTGDGRPSDGNFVYRNDPFWRDFVLFHEYFHGDDGYGLGASHQTGWTALVARLVHDLAGEE